MDEQTHGVGNNRLTVLAGEILQAHQASILGHYRDSSPNTQAALRDMFFRQWAMRADNDPWGIFAGGVYDEIEKMRRKAAGGRA